MFSPGYEEENKTKPDLVLKIEETDGGLTQRKLPKDCTKVLCLRYSMFK
jgi:hypothetical protein